MNRRLAWTLASSPVLLLAACGGGDSGGGAAAQMDLIEASNGFGLMLPHQVFKADAQGLPTQQLVAIRNMTDLVSNVGPQNPVLPVTEWPAGATLPNGDADNHFIYVEFTQPIDVATALDPSPAGQANSGLIGPITVQALDPTTGQSVPVVGRAFIGGPDAGAHQPGHDLPALREVHPEPVPQGRGKVPGGIPGSKGLSAIGGEGNLTAGFQNEPPPGHMIRGIGYSDAGVTRG